jgi:hypothetical protein
MPSQRTLTNISRTLNTNGIPVPVRAVLSLSESDPGVNEWEWVVMQDSWGIMEGYTLTVNDPSEIDGWQFNWSGTSKLRKELQNYEVINPNDEMVSRFFVEKYYSRESDAINYSYIMPDPDSPNFTLKVLTLSDTGTVTLHEPMEGDVLILNLIPHDLQDLPLQPQS